MKNNFKNESKTINLEQNISHQENNPKSVEKDTLEDLSNENVEEIKPEFEMIDDYNEYDNQSESQSNKEDDLLQIPAFLRRQAN